MTASEVALKIRKGELDCNQHQLFFSKLIKALMVDLRNSVKVRNIPVPHMILNTGDDTMWLIERGYDFSQEPREVSNEDGLYNIIPRCHVEPGSLNLLPDQLTNPYTSGIFQYETSNQLYTFHAEFRRMPVKLSVNLKYLVDSFTDALELMQQACTKMAFVKLFSFVYMGQTIQASYKIPDSFDDQHLTEISGDAQESRNRTIEMSIEVESYIPIYSPHTVCESVPLTQGTIRVHVEGETINHTDPLL